MNEFRKHEPRKKPKEDRPPKLVRPKIDEGLLLDLMKRLQIPKGSHADDGESTDFTMDVVHLKKLTAPRLVTDPIPQQAQSVINEDAARAWKEIARLIEQGLREGHTRRISQFVELWTSVKPTGPPEVVQLEAHYDLPSGAAGMWMCFTRDIESPIEHAEKYRLVCAISDLQDELERAPTTSEILVQVNQSRANVGKAEWPIAEVSRRTKELGLAPLLSRQR